MPRLIDFFRRLFGQKPAKPKPPVSPPPPPPPVVVPPSPPSPPASDLVQSLLAAHNKTRAQYGVGPLKLVSSLIRAAQEHSDDQARREKMGHDGSDGSTPFQRMTRAGYRYMSAGENVAMGYKSVAAVMDGWMGSPGHRDNILRAYTEVGFGMTADSVGRCYWTACFANPSNAKLQLETSGYAAFFPGGIIDPDLTQDMPV